MDVTAWIAFFTGIYALAAGVGELRAPGYFLELFSDYEHYPGLRYVTGIVCLMGGAAIYLVNPWDVGDPLAMLVSVTGGLLAAQGAAFIAVGERAMALARPLVGVRGLRWACFSVAVGVLLVFAAFMRIT